MHFKTLFIGFFALILLNACTTSHETEFTENQVIEKFHKAYFPNQIQTASDDVAIYLDFSSGMKIAFKNESNAAFYELFINSLKISEVSFYEVADYNVKLIEGLSRSSLYAQIKDADKFTKINAPLNKALTQIVGNNSQSVFITDGELWEDGERDDPWAREEFGNWLKAGNTIDFYVTDFYEDGKEKHVFFMFFVPAKLGTETENLSEVFEYYLSNAPQAKSIPYTKFSFSNASYKLKREYETETSGGSNISAEIDTETFVNMGNESHFEFHEYYLGWNDMVKYIRNATDEEGRALKGGEPIISKQFMEVASLEFYSVEALDIKVYNISKSMAELIRCQACIANPPVFATNENGKRLLDDDNLPIIDTPGKAECYDEFGKLTADTLFRKANLSELKEVYRFDNEAFMNNYKEQGRGEFIVKIHPNFNGKQLTEADYNLHRIDVYLKDVTEKTDNPNLAKFIWDGKQVARNRSMYNSVLGALREANPQNKVIYTYYVKTMPNDYEE